MKEYSYLESKITSDGRSCKEIISRINQAKVIFNKKKKPYHFKQLKGKKEFGKDICVECFSVWERIMDDRRRREEKSWRDDN